MTPTSHLVNIGDADISYDVTMLMEPDKTIGAFSNKGMLLLPVLLLLILLLILLLLPLLLLEQLQRVLSIQNQCGNCSWSSFSSW